MKVASRAFPALLLAVAGGALAIRLPRLNERPMHADESVQAAIFRNLWQHGTYRYNPEEFHGPTLPYATLVSVWIGQPENFAETTASTYRIVPVIFGVGMIALLWLLGDALGKAASLCAAVLFAISPAMVFYSRYFIHETLLIFFTLALVGTSWRYVRSGRFAWCLAAGTCLGLVQATKETCAIVYLAMGVALLLTWLWSRRVAARDEPATQGPRLCGWQVVMGAVVAVLVAVTLLSSFFANPRGPVDGVLTYLPWLSRAGGASPHVHSWLYYVHILAWWHVGDGPVWSEGLILALATVGFIAALFSGGCKEKASGRGGEGATGGWDERPADSRLFSPPLPLSPSPPRPPAESVSIPADARFVRWLGFYTLALTAIYCAIPYKTPWCLLGPLQGMILLAGFGAVALVRVVPTLPLKALAAIILLGATAQLARQSYRANYELPADPANPYVYAHTRPKIADLEHILEQLAAATPQGHAMPVKVIWKDAYYWPLPWYLRRFEHVELWTRMPQDPAAPVVISSPEYGQEIWKDLGREDVPELRRHDVRCIYEIRPGVFAQLWVRGDLWIAHLRRLGRL